MDGNNFIEHPAASLAALSTPPAQSVLPIEAGTPPEVAVPAYSAIPANALTANQPSASQMPSQTPWTTAISNLADVNARTLLEELRTGQLSTERAFLERARTLGTDYGLLAPTTPAISKTEPLVAKAPMPADLLASEPTPAPISAEFKLDTRQLPELPSAGSIAPAVVETTEPVVSPAATPAVAPQANIERHLIFSLGNIRYAVPLSHIIEIAELEHYTPVPNVPEWIAGITNLRGDILSLVDLNALRGEAPEDLTLGSNLLVTELVAEELTTCLVVDRVHGVASVNPDQIQRFDKMSGTGLSSFTRGYVSEGTGLLCLIDLEALLRSMVLAH